MSAADRPTGPTGPGRDDGNNDHEDDNDDDNAFDEETTAMNAPFSTPSGHTTDDHTAADDATRPDQPLDAPLPYGTGFATTQQYGWGVEPQPVRYTPPTVATQEPEKARSGSPVLAAAGLLSMGVAVWAILGAPLVTTTMLLAGGLVVAVLVGLVMVVRR